MTYIVDQSIPARLRRFMRKVSVDPQTECWIWQGATDSQRRYGVACWDKRKGQSHRVSWELHNGEIPDGMKACHKCDVTLCVNPEHLFIGTQEDNMRDCAAKGRAHKRGPRGEAHGMSKLAMEQVREIRERLAGGGEFHKDIATSFGVSRSLISMISRGVVWSHG